MFGASTTLPASEAMPEIGNQTEQAIQPNWQSNQIKGVRGTRVLERPHSLAGEVGGIDAEALVLWHQGCDRHPHDTGRSSARAPRSPTAQLNCQCPGDATLAG